MHGMYLASWMESMQFSKELVSRPQCPISTPNWFKKLIQSDEYLSQSYKTFFTSATNQKHPKSELLKLSNFFSSKKSQPHKLQEIFSDLIHNDKKSELVNTVIGLHEKSRLSSISSTGASDWLRALPAEPHLYLDNDVFRTRLCRYLGLPPTYLIPQTCICGSKIDTPHAQHIPACSQLRHFTHDIMVHER